MEKKYLQFAGIKRIQTDVNYDEVPLVQVTFALVPNTGDLHVIDDAKNELIAVIDEALNAHLQPPSADFTHFDRVMADLKTFDWSKHFQKKEQPRQ